MFILTFVMLIFFMIPDLMLGIPLGGIEVRFQFCGLLLCYLLLNNNLTNAVITLVLYSLLAVPFTAVTVTGTILSFAIVFIIFDRIKHDLFTDSAFIQGVWVFWILSIQKTLLYFFEFGLGQVSAWSMNVVEGVINNLVMAVLSIPLFAAIRLLTKRLFVSFYGDRWQGTGPNLEGKHRDEGLL